MLKCTGGDLDHSMGPRLAALEYDDNEIPENER